MSDRTSRPGPSRRGLLGGLAAAASATWIDRAFAAEPPDRQVELFATWHEARRSGVPLMAIVIPPEGARDRGHEVGAAIAEADDELLAALGAYAPVCATALDLHLLGVIVPDHAWFVVIGTDAIPARVVPIRGPEGETRHPGECAEILRERLTALAPSFGVAVGGVALAQVRETWIASRLPGSYWARYTGCGMLVEGYEGYSVSYACGMGHVTDPAYRFLYFVDRQT